MKNIKIIALDFDGTFLNSLKEIPQENLEALALAKEKGVLIVPATGRLPKAIPEPFKSESPYYICVNGAIVYDSIKHEIISTEYISNETALKIYSFAKTLPCIYDSYIENVGYINKDMYDMLEDYFIDKFYAKVVKTVRTPIDDLEKFVIENHHTPQKMQYFFQDLDLRDQIMLQINKDYPDLVATTSLESNIEINQKNATKGNALEKLCKYLDIPIECSVAIGDGTNDLSMIKSAGIGVCMINGADECKEVADIVTKYDNNEGGAGKIIKELLS